MEWLHTLQTTDYCGHVIYENNVLKRILIDGGYYENGTYYFYLTDHLGNNRVVANQSGAVIQSTQYYPFGMAFADGTNPSAQPYKFGGKELDSDRGLNLYDFHARWQDAALGGRFLSVDPLAEKYYWISPYVYCMNNPVRFVDPDGMQASDTIACILPEVHVVARKVKESVSGFWLSLYYSIAGRTVTTPVYGVDGQGNKSLSPIGSATFNVDNSGYITTIVPMGGVAPSPSTSASSIKDIPLLLKAGKQILKNGLSAASRALQKHGSRPGSIFPQAKGNSTTVNQQGEAFLEDILKDPNVQRVVNNSSVAIGRYGGNVVDYKIPGGRGVRFSSDEKTFIGFLEP